LFFFFFTFSCLRRASTYIFDGSEFKGIDCVECASFFRLGVLSEFSEFCPRFGVFSALEFSPGEEEPRLCKSPRNIIGVVLDLFFKRMNNFGFSSTAQEVAAAFANEISGRVFVITGGYGGIGAQTAIALLEQNATVIVAGRSQQSIAAFKEEHSKYGDRLRGGLIDLGDLVSVKSFANTLLAEGKPIDVLINNAGLMATPEGRTVQGHEVQFGTNVVGHFLLSKLILPLLKKSSKGGRIVWLSSVGECLF
jgi:hypothetical protein